MKRIPCCALIAASLLIAPATVPAAPPPRHDDAADTPASGFDLASARFGQDGKTLSLELVTQKDWTVAQLSPQTGRSLCVLLFPKTGNTRVCAVPDGEGGLALRWSRLDAGGHPVASTAVAGTATHPDARTLRATFTPAAAHLQPGTYRWRAQTGWVDATPACPPGRNSCTDYLPDGGSIPATLVPPDPGLPVGCTATGATERRRGPAGRKMVALTFDDGPAPITAQFLDLLEREHAVATFFMIGRQVAGKRTLLRRMLKDGDMIGNHSWAHGNLGGGGVSGDLAATNAAIRRASGFTPCLFRPPYGSTGPGLRSDVAGLHMLSILWDVDPTDWANPGAGAIASRVLSQVRDGSIVLSHDGGGPRGGTLAAYAQIIPALKRRGYKLVTLTELLGLRVVHEHDPPA